MINREVSYERSMNNSYMKIPATPESSYDEERMLKKPIHGLLPVEKCYINGRGQYWYNFSGKQALDTYCRVNRIGGHLFENLILRLCEQIEILEWNLMDGNCLVADPEMVFLSHGEEEIFFVVYPGNQGDLLEEVRQFMEYLLTKLDHEDKDGVSTAYQIYEISMSEGVSIGEIKQYILNARMKQVKTLPTEEIVPVAEAPVTELVAETTDKWYESYYYSLKKTMMEFVSTKKEKLLPKLETVFPKISRWQGKAEKSEEKQGFIVYPDDMVTEKEVERTYYPTVCLSGLNAEATGKLVCERGLDYPELHLTKSSQIIGKSNKAQLQIARDTISQLHARVDYQNGKYYIEDLNSTNGTYVNETALNYKERLCLATGDRVRFADINYYFL